MKTEDTFDDKNCYTLPDGNCVGEGPCMHDAPSDGCKNCAKDDHQFCLKPASCACAMRGHHPKTTDATKGAEHLEAFFVVAKRLKRIRDDGGPLNRGDYYYVAALAEIERLRAIEDADKREIARLRESITMALEDCESNKVVDAEAYLREALR